MSVLTTRPFWAAAAERAIKTFAQTFIGVFAIDGLTPADIDWQQSLFAAGIATALSVLTSIASVPVGDPGPSLAAEELPHPGPSLDVDQ